MAGRLIGEASTDDLQAVLAKLESLHAEAEWIYDFVHETGKSAAEKAEWTARAKALKDKLESEHKQMDTIAGESALSPAERIFYRGTIREASVNMRITRGAAPNPKWGDSAYRVKGDLRHTIYQIMDELKERGV